MGEVSPNSPNRQAEEGWPLVAIRRPQQVMAEAAAAAPTCAGGAGGGDDATQGAVPHMQGGAYERQTLQTRGGGGTGDDATQGAAPHRPLRQGL